MLNSTNSILKSLFVLLALFVPLIWPLPIPFRQNFLFAIIVPLLTGLLLIVSRVYMRRRMSGEEPQAPRWSDAIVNFREPLELFQLLPFFQFLGILLIGLGLGLLLGTYLAYAQIQAFGVGAIGMGIGLLAGIQLSVNAKS